MDRFESMSVFAAVVAEGSLSAAGRRLGMPLPSVSRKVSELEALVQAKLLVRSTRKLALTAAGESYLVACRRILADVAEAERGASSEYAMPRGELVMTAPLVFGRVHVLPIVTKFLVAYPLVDVRLLLTDRPLHLIDDHLDVAVRIGALRDSRIVASRLGQISTVVCASPDYLSRRGEPTTPAQIAGHDCVSFEPYAGSALWSFRGARGVQIHARLIVNTAEAAIDAAATGLGLTRVLSYQVATAVASGALQLVLQRFRPAAVPVSLIHLPATPLKRNLRAFLDFAVPRLRTQLGSTGEDI